MLCSVFWMARTAVGVRDLERDVCLENIFTILFLHFLTETEHLQQQQQLRKRKRRINFFLSKLILLKVFAKILFMQSEGNTTDKKCGKGALPQNTERVSIDSVSILALITAVHFAII